MPQYDAYPMVLNGVYLGMVGVRSDQKNYFNIPNPTEAELQAAKYNTSGDNYTKQVYTNRLDDTTTTRTVTVDRRTRTKTRAKDHKMRGGRPIKVPTELRSAPPAANTTDGSQTRVPRETVRTTTFRFPGNADLSEISAWLFAKLTAHKPNHMSSPGGRTYPLAPFGTGQVTGQASNTTP